MLVLHTQREDNEFHFSIARTKKEYLKVVCLAGNGLTAIPRFSVDERCRGGKRYSWLSKPVALLQIKHKSFSPNVFCLTTRGPKCNVLSISETDDLRQ